MTFYPDWSLYEQVKNVVGNSVELRDDFNMLLPLRERLAGNRLLDFGCGAAPHRKLIENCGYDWHGLDVRCSRDPGSKRVAHIMETCDKVTLYDGGVIPLADGSFDAVFAHQSLEHVHNPNVSFAEIARILKPNGALIGSVSHLEPYHGYSTFNYSPYGFKLICERWGLTVESLTAGMDVFTLSLRALCNLMGYQNMIEMIDQSFYFRNTPVNALFARLPGNNGSTAAEINTAMLHVCGQFTFLASKTDKVTDFA